MLQLALGLVLRHMHIIICTTQTLCFVQASNVLPNLLPFSTSRVLHKKMHCIKNSAIVNHFSSKRIWWSLMNTTTK